MSTDRLSRRRVVPYNFGPLRDANGNARITGPCGDTVEFWIKVEDGLIKDCTYTTDGCSNSSMCGCVAADLALDMPLEDAKKLTQADVLAKLPGLREEEKHCALLAVNTLKAAIDNFEKHNETNNS